MNTLIANLPMDYKSTIHVQWEFKFASKNETQRERDRAVHVAIPFKYVWPTCHQVSTNGYK